MRALLLAAALAACASSSAIDIASMDDATFEHELARRFQYEPPAPGPVAVDDQRAGQIADAAYFLQFPDYDRAYAPAARAEARRLAQRLHADAGDLTHEQFVLRVAEIAALADNGHTAIDENAFKKNTPRLPLRTYLFADGLYVVWASEAYAHLLGARVDMIDGRDIDDIYRVIRRYAGGTEARRRLVLLPMLESPALLHAAGVASHRDSLTLRGVSANGQPFEVAIPAEERNRSAWVSSSQRLLFPTGADGRMRSLMPDDPDALPVYLRRRSNLFSADSLPEGGFYIGLGHNGDADESPIGVFLDAATARIRAERPRYVVLDMRMNGGGDYTTTYGFARALPEAAGGAQIYVLTSGWTFSAAITTVAALEDAGGDQVTIVGEPVGDRLDFWAEGGSFALPNAFVLVHYAAGRHNYAGACTDRETCFWLNERYPVRVRTLEPDIAAPLTFAAYRALRDPAIEAVLAAESSRAGSARTR